MCSYLRVQSAIPAYPWKEPIDWERLATNHGEPFIRFASLVRTKPTNKQNTTFSEFSNLPAELQLYVLRFCDHATLYQLMHTSSLLRQEAKKLFWSARDIWYLVEGIWLLDGGFPGHADHAIEVLPLVEQIEVEFSDFFATSKSLQGDRIAFTVHGDVSGRPETVIEIIRKFWHTLQTRFPKIKTVIISTVQFRDGTSLPADMKSIIRMCPDGITVLGSILADAGDRDNGKRSMLRRLWQRVEDSNGVEHWQVVEAAWTRKSVLLPLKEFHGVAGRFAQYLYHDRFQSYEVYVMDLLCTEAIERHHFEDWYEPFHCLEPGCGHKFDRPGQYTVHVIDIGHQIKWRDWESPLVFKDDFEKYEENLSRRWERIGWQGWLEEMGYPDTEKRRQAEKTFLDQLAHDPLYNEGVPPESTLIYHRWQWHGNPDADL
ncbi:hypothetical protein BU24DRAFT_426031 [Aaosphaeria arxii CBS 175.79]|uniref:C2H2-type domain-containing protein n=1 Tax=Aaosphaeria arxii CBS 175.79 TaxID=1450172 RepID=A0A6A5XH63_9PLEO|nr:uncharacterized protein BU24DRAFT_426031 [Aaosphaeria arxii CBS 175.79]KAF2012186.1 hypothetical protein BU24DRAFT_426031 [Aaosphaeria arxii CBS 175.79]